jgi:hypothetical protein
VRYSGLTGLELQGWLKVTAKIVEPIQHTIPKRELQNTLHKGTDRLEDSIQRLMSAIVLLRVQEQGDWVTKRVQLLGGNKVPTSRAGMRIYGSQGS